MCSKSDAMPIGSKKSGNNGGVLMADDGLGYCKGARAEKAAQLEGR